MAWPIQNAVLLDYDVRPETADWELWEKRIPQVEIDPHSVIRADVVINTVDTARHADVIGQWLSQHKPLILCGPPGSGKSMTLTGTLLELPLFAVCS